MNSPVGKTLRLRALLALNVLFCRLYHQIDVLSPPRLPRRGAAILVCNHVSGLDPLVLQAVCRRPIVWMMAKEYYELPWLKPLFQAVDAIPVDRGKPESGATRTALRVLGAGRVLGIFPEAKWETSRDLLPFQTGVAMMAVRTATPIFPAWLDGTQRNKEMLAAVGFPNRAAVRFGPEVALDRSSHGREALAPNTRRIEAAVRELMNTGAPWQTGIWRRRVGQRPQVRHNFEFLT